MRIIMKTKTFSVTVDGGNKEFIVRSPSVQDQKEASKVYNQEFSDAIKAKAVVRAKIDDLLKEQGLWDDIKQLKLGELQNKLLDNERKLAKGGIPLSEARQIALDMKKLRDDIRDLISVRTSLDNHTAEGQADNARFNYLVSVCVVYNDNKEPYFRNMEDYLNRATEQVALLGAQNLANMIYGLDNDYETNLPENKFLKKFRFVDDKLRLIDKKGRLVDADGRLIDESGRFIDEEGNFVDKYGNKVTQDGDYIVEPQPFLDDNGNPIVLEEEKKDEPAKPEPTSAPPQPQPTTPETTAETAPPPANS
jgi:hypothetical protein